MLTKPVENSIILLMHMAVYPRVPRCVWIRLALCRLGQQTLLWAPTEDVGAHYGTKD